MIFHVAGADVADFALELVKKVDRVLAQYIDQHVEAAAVRHTNTDFLGPVTADPLNRFTHHRYQALSTLKTEPLGAGIFRAQRALETLSTVQLTQDIEPLFGGKIGRTAHRFHAAHDPMPLLGIHNVHELRAHGAAIGGGQVVTNVCQRGFGPTEVDGAHLKDRV